MHTLHVKWAICRRITQTALLRFVLKNTECTSQVRSEAFAIRVIIWSLFGRGRVGNSALLPARARTARGGTLFSPFWRARACSRHRSQEQSDNKNSTIDTTSTCLHTRREHHSFAHYFIDFCFVSVGAMPASTIASSHVTTVDEKQTTQHQPEQGQKPCGRRKILFEFL